MLDCSTSDVHPYMLRLNFVVEITSKNVDTIGKFLMRFSYVFNCYPLLFLSEKNTNWYGARITG